LFFLILCHILRMHPKISASRNTQNQPLIELRQLTKTYQEGGREHIILRDINTVIQAGEFVVLLGRSGSGKSTSLNLLSGIDLPTSGEIAFNGIALNRLSEEERTLFR